MQHSNRTTITMICLQSISMECSISLLCEYISRLTQNGMERQRLQYLTMLILVFGFQTQTETIQQVSMLIQVLRRL